MVKVSSVALALYSYPMQLWTESCRSGKDVNEKIMYIHKPGTNGIKLQEEEPKTAEQQRAREQEFFN